MDPAPENIEGRLVQKHTFHHEVNWGYVSIALAVIVLIYVLYSSYDDDDEEAL